MPIVFDNVELPGTAADAGARVDVYLVASLTDSTVEGVIAASDISILDKNVAYTDTAGYVQFTLRANSLITPSNTYYIWETHFKDGRVNRRAISVPNGAGPYHVGDITTSPAAAVSPFVLPLDGQGTEASKPSNATMVAAGNRTGWTWYSTDWKVTWRFDGTIWRPISGFIGSRVRRTTNQSINNAASTQITAFDTELTDNQNFHAASGSSLVIPTGLGGTYSAGCSLRFASNSTGVRALDLVHSSLGVVASDIRPTASGIDVRITISVDGLQCADASSFTMSAYQTSGGALNIEAASAYSMVLWCSRTGE